MATIKFLIQSSKNPAKIYVRLREGRSIDLKVATSYLVNPNDWNSSKGKVKHTKDENLRLIDERLKNIQSDLLKEYNKNIGEIAFDSFWLKSFLNPTEYSKNSIPNALVEYFEYYKSTKKNQLTKSSIGKLSVIVNFIKQLENQNSKKILIKEVNENFMNLLLDFGVENNYKQNYISKIFSSIKTICYDAESNGITIDSKLRRLKIKEEEVSKIYLTEYEIAKIESLELRDNEALDNARDWLILCCETAQRVSDLIKYDVKNIRYEKNKSGKSIPLLEFKQKKTSSLMAIPLSPKVQNILIKRGGDFPRKISDQILNKHIKKIAHLSGLTELIYGGVQDATNRKIMGMYPKWQLVTTHIGRRTFATNKFGIIPTPLIMTMTGHKTEHEFLKYIGKTETSKALQLSEYL